MGAVSRAATCAGEHEAPAEAHDSGGVVPEEVPCGGGGAVPRSQNLARERRVDFGVDRASWTLAAASTIAYVERAPCLHLARRERVYVEGSAYFVGERSDVRLS